MLTRENIKRITSLREKKYREIYNQFVVEGEKTVAELLASSFETVSIYALNSWIGENAPLVNQKQIPLVEISEKELERISNFTAPNKVLAVAKIRKMNIPEMPAGKGFTLMLDDIRDPGNMGTIIRTADWFGFEQIICSLESVDIYNPKVIQATMGSFLRVNVVYDNLKDVLLKNSRLSVLGAFMNGTPVNEIKNLVKSGIVIIGSEAKGITPELMPFITDKISIPLVSQGKSVPESMNAAIAAGIVMYELSRK